MLIGKNKSLINMKIKYLKYIGILFILFPFLVFAQSFTASTNNTTVGLQNQFQVSFTFQGQDINSLSNFSPPNFNNFLVLSGPNQSSSMQIINGAVSGSQTMSYYLQPRNLGKFTIGSASITYKGKTYKTDPLAITVIKGSPKPQRNQSTNNGNATVSNDEIAKNLFIRATADRSTAYLGEPVTVTYKLYTRLSIASQMSISKLPQYQGFWAEELETSNNISFTTEMVDGRQFRVGILKKVELFPSQTGELSVTPFELDVPVRIRRHRSNDNFFNDFFNDPFDMGQTVNYHAKSNTIKIKVKDLPAKNKPADFNGSVGQFVMSSSLDKTKVKTNNSVDLKIVISGSGNIQLLDLPEVKFPSGIDQYEPKTSEQIDRQGRVSGKKTFDYLLVPRTPGKKIIPPIKFSYFNPGKRSYETLATPEYTLNVEQGSGNSNQEVVSSNLKEGIRQLGTDIRFIKTDAGDLSKKGKLELNTIGFWAAAGLPLLALIGLIGWKKRDDRISGNVQLLRYTQAQKVAKSRLKKAKELMSSNNQAEFYTEISQALFGYLEDKFRIPKSEFSLDRAADELFKKNISSDLINEMKNTAEKCEYVRFAPGADGKAAMSEMYNEMAKVIIGLERSIGAKKYV